jgi:uncharacterized repeat protein (TIGR01451 family)
MMSNRNNKHSNYLLKYCIQLLLVGGVLSLSSPAWAQYKVQDPVTRTAALRNQATAAYRDNQSTPQAIISSSPNSTSFELIDPLGRVTGCDGEILTDYQGFIVGLYETPNGTDLGPLVSLTQTELPDNPNNTIPGGLAPNTTNSNPFFLTASGGGTYNFLFDASKGQLDVGRTYILVITPPSGSIYSQRRIQLRITSRVANNVTYEATTLDGNPISITTDPQLSTTATTTIGDAATIGLSLITGLRTSACQPQEIQITKIGDRAVAEPGDTVVYRVSVKNLSASGLDIIRVTDSLPLGFDFLANSVRAEIGGSPVAIAATRNGLTVTFDAPGTSIPVDQTLNIAYAATLTPDSIRGTGLNSAVVAGRRISNNRPVKAGPATYRLRIRPGILSDRGTILGAVFIDKNFDGEQQPGEAGVPNAVVYMDDGVRITTDANGLFSLASAGSGPRTGVLDLSSLPGYTLAPNFVFIEANSQSRLVNLEPGGLVRMNFAVTPTFQEQGK